MKKIIEEKELKCIQQDILDDVAHFCEINDIHYFLAYGTLIGAIRHKGYIPWDDDIDIAMPRPDYDKFIKEYSSSNGLYEIINHYNNQNYGLPFSKVYHKNTIMKETNYKGSEYGVYIDVFPIDGFMNEKQVKLCRRYGRLLNAKKAKWGGSRSFVKNLLILLVKIIYIWLPINAILNKIDKKCREGSYRDCRRVGYIPSLSMGLKEIVDKNLISERVKHVFENNEYYIPKNYDPYLRQLYGDYMIYPPEAERKSTHVFEAYWK